MGRPFQSKAEVNRTCELLAAVYSVHETLPYPLVAGIMHDLERATPHTVVYFYQTLYSLAPDAVLAYFSGIGNDILRDDKFYDKVRESRKYEIKKEVDNILDFLDEI